MNSNYLLLLLFNTVGLLVAIALLYLLRWAWAFRRQILFSPQDVVLLRQALDLETRKREELQEHIQRLEGQVDLLATLLRQSKAKDQKQVKIVNNGKSLDRAFVPDSPMDIIGVWPLSRHAPPLDLERDFADFMKNGGHWNYHALKDHVPYSRLVKKFRRHVRSGKRVAIFYAACHGHDKGLLFSDGWAKPRQLAELMMLGQVQLAILAACSTSKVADAMRRAGVPAVIYMSGEVLDSDAIALSRSIIAGLADGLSLEKALAFARAEFRDNAVAHATLQLTGNHDFSNLTLAT